MLASAAPAAASPTAWLATGLLTVVLVIAAATDVKTGKVFNWLTYPAMLGGLAFWTVAGGIGAGLDGGPAGWAAGSGNALLSALGATLLGLIGFGLLVQAGGLGFGDVKLMGAVGALSGSWQCLFSTTVYAFALGLVLAIGVMIRKGLVKRTFHRLVNVLLSKAARAPATIPDDSPKLPFAVPIAIGGVLAAAEVLLGLDTPWAPKW